jgi:hypothetical protein
MSSVTNRLYDQLAKPLTSAAVGGLLFSAQFPGRGLDIKNDIPFFNGTLSSAQIGAIFGFISSFVVTSINNTMLAIDKQNSLNTSPSFIVHAVGSSVAWVVLPRLVQRGPGGIPQSTLITYGMLSEMISAYVYQNLIAKEGGLLPNLIGNDPTFLR